MARSSSSKNGSENRPAPNPDVIKIVVVGEPECGKTTFIKTFYELNRLNGFHEAENCIIFPIKYEMTKKTHHANIFDFNSFRKQNPLEALKKHTDANGFVFMYAIDDPSSFQGVVDKWYANLESLMSDETPAILVGNKRDLRDNPQVIQRLARANQVPVTEEQGKNLVREKPRLGKYFDCSAAQNLNLIDAFEQILAWARAHLDHNPGIWL